MLNMGNAMAAFCRFDEAISVYQEILEICPEYPDAAYNIGHTYEEQGKTDDAAVWYTKTLEIDPEYHHAKEQLELLKKGNQDLFR